MSPLQRNAIMIRLIKQLRDSGSWCGETHVQKAVYMLQDVTGVKTDLDFVLYKHGPFSFELRDELTAMRADDLLELRVQPQPYGPKLLTTEQSEKIEGKFPKTLAQYESQIKFITEIVGDKGVSELEKLATSIFIIRRERPNDSANDQATYLNEIKPHISLGASLEAINEATKLIIQAKQRRFLEN